MSLVSIRVRPRYAVSASTSRLRVSAVLWAPTAPETLFRRSTLLAHLSPSLPALGRRRGRLRGKWRTIYRTHDVSTLTWRPRRPGDITQLRAAQRSRGREQPSRFVPSGVSVSSAPTTPAHVRSRHAHRWMCSLADVGVVGGRRLFLV
ncbi:hypothetical protein MSAN_00489800 [Mycena sanguinolenta]|uniref:Uncharacterized protein n=1 Tax=Mycena sanguinolenta TaxID=230812 RepID=A0A8H7DHW1_9AGAR|nr:hypothetical protein MSAN_00489800 [Mycena sanguinolenta]